MVLKLYYNKTSYKWLPFKMITAYIIGLLILAIIGPVRFEFDYFYLILVVLYILAFVIVTWLGMAMESVFMPRIIATPLQKNKLIFWLKLAIIVAFPIKIMLVISSIQTMGLPSYSCFFSALASVYTTMHNEETVINVYRQIDTFCNMVFCFFTFAGGKRATSPEKWKSRFRIIAFTDMCEVSA